MKKLFFLLALAPSAFLSGCGGGGSSLPTPTPVPTGTPTATPVATPTSPTGRIIFWSDRGGSANIYQMNVDGSNQKALTQNSGDNRYPQFDGPGNRIAFESNRDGDFEIFTINSSGLDVRALTQNTFSDTFPAWSPDGSRIVFSSNRSGAFRLYTMRSSDGGDVQQLTTDVITGDHLRPIYSPNGQRILFQVEIGGPSNSRLWSIPTGGGTATKITNGEYNEGGAAFNSSGSMLTFRSGRTGNPDIYVAEGNVTSTSNARRITTNEAFEGGSAFSPDSMQLAYRSDRTGSADIFRINLDGTGEVNLTNNGAFDAAPDWR